MLLTHFFISYIFIISALAGFAILWRNWLVDHPSWKQWIFINLKSTHKILTCGSCFSYWISLLVILIWNPLFLLFSFILKTESYIIISLFSWMSLSFGVVSLRFLYVALQEYVSSLVHRDGHHH